MEKKFNPITVNADKGIYKTDVSNKMQVELRQEVVTSYPSIKLGNNKADALFTNDEAGVKTQDFVDTRVAWLPVGNITDIDAVTTKLESLAKATLYKVLSLQPILTDNDETAIANELTTLEHIATKQRTKDKDGNIVNFKGLPQYRRVFFSTEGKADIDLRPTQYSSMNIDTVGIQKSISIAKEKEVVA